MTDDRMRSGLQMIEAYAGNEGMAAVEAIRDLHPELYRYVVEFGFGDVYRKDGLPPEMKAASTISSLIALGDTDGQLAFHVKAALRAGLSAEQVQGILMHCIPYAGFPRVLNAFQVARPILDQWHTRNE